MKLITAMCSIVLREVLLFFKQLKSFQSFVYLFRLTFTVQKAQPFDTEVSIFQIQLVGSKGFHRAC